MRFFYKLDRSLSTVSGLSHDNCDGRLVIIWWKDKKEEKISILINKTRCGITKPDSELQNGNHEYKTGILITNSHFSFTKRESRNTNGIHGLQVDSHFKVQFTRSTLEYRHPAAVVKNIFDKMQNIFDI